MLIKTFVGGAFEVNNYVIACEETKMAAMIDSGGFAENNIKRYLEDNSLTLQYLFLTHGHLDHICGAKTIHEMFNVPVYLKQEDRFLLDMLESQLAIYGMPPAKPVEKTTSFHDGEKIMVGNIEITVIATPGHSPGCVCYYIPAENKIFVGDTLFAGSIGRTDLPGGSYDQIMKSIAQKLMVLPDETEVFSGHGPVTTIEEEKNSNPFVNDKLR